MTFVGGSSPLTAHRQKQKNIARCFFVSQSSGAKNILNFNFKTTASENRLRRLSEDDGLRVIAKISRFLTRAPQRIFRDKSFEIKIVNKKFKIIFSKKSYPHFSSKKYFISFF